MRAEALRSSRRHSPSAPAATRAHLDAILLLAVSRAAYDNGQMQCVKGAQTAVTRSKLIPAREPTPIASAASRCRL